MQVRDLERRTPLRIQTEVDRFQVQAEARLARAGRECRRLENQTLDEVQASSFRRRVAGESLLEFISGDEREGRLESGGQELATIDGLGTGQGDRVRAMEARSRERTRGRRSERGHGQERGAQ